MKHLACFLLLVLALAPAASAGGIVKFHIPAVADAKVGDTITATIYNDNNLAPPAGEVVLLLDWNPEILKFDSAAVTQGHTTNADLIGTHNLEIRSADTVNGLANGDEPLATVTYKVIGPGRSPIVIDVRSVHDTTGADITSKAVSRNGEVTATGTAVPTGSATVTQTTVPTTGTTISPTGSLTVLPTTGITTSPTGIITGITTGITTSATFAPVTAGSDGSVSHDSDEYTGVVTKTATPTPTVTKTVTATTNATPNATATANVTTAKPTTSNTTSTPTPIITATANATTAKPATSNATPTATKAALPFGLLALAALGLVAARRH